MHNERLNNDGLHPTVLEAVIAFRSEQVGGPDYGQVAGGHPCLLVGQGELAEMFDEMGESVEVGLRKLCNRSP